ncbi:MAG: HEAT repeat domain-containing protein, partial [Bradymonadia bacterium]
SQKAATSLKDLALRDDDDDVKTAATYALGQLVEWGGRESLQFLREIVTSIESPEVLIAAMRTLCFYRAPDHVDLFKKCLTHPNERLRQLGFIGLGQSGVRSCLPYLVKGLTDASTHVQRLAARSIGDLGAHESVDAMLTAASGASAELRTAVAEACKSFEKNDLLAPLSSGAQHSDSNLRKVTAYVAAKVGLLDICVALTKDPDPIVRKQATLGLADLYEIASEEVLVAAIKALDDEAWQVRVAGVEALGRMQDERGLEPMREHADDSNHVVKQAIRRTLSKF